jgi:hypothetical protein
MPGAQSGLVDQRILKAHLRAPAEFCVHYGQPLDCRPYGERCIVRTASCNVPWWRRKAHAWSSVDSPPSAKTVRLNGGGLEFDCRATLWKVSKPCKRVKKFQRDSPERRDQVALGCLLLFRWLSALGAVAGVSWRLARFRLLFLEATALFPACVFVPLDVLCC